jgi:hypothetical protein
MKFPFTPSPQYTAIALAYANKDLIADMILPRMTVTERSFKWDLHTKADMFTVPSTLVGRKGRPNEVEFTAVEQSASVSDYGLGFTVPNEDIDAASAKPGLDPLGRHTEGTTDLILLDREQRVASKLFNAATYPSGNKVTLSGNDQWSAFAQASSDPVEDVLAAMEGMLMRPNTMVLGSQAWYQLRRHPKLLAAIYPTGSNATTGGVATLNQIKEVLEIQNIYIGSAYINTSNPGQAATYARIWGKHAAMFHLNPLAGLRGNGISFGATAEYGSRIAFTRPDPDVGLRGGVRGKVGESCVELITAPDCGYFFENVVA